MPPVIPFLVKVAVAVWPNIMAATGYSVAAAAAFGASIVAAGSALVSRGLKKVLGKEINFPSSIAGLKVSWRSPTSSDGGGVPGLPSAPPGEAPDIHTY